MTKQVQGVLNEGQVGSLPRQGFQFGELGDLCTNFEGQALTLEEAHAIHELGGARIENFYKRVETSLKIRGERSSG